VLVLACVYSLFHRKGTCDTDPPEGLEQGKGKRKSKGV
jgi:hypothetical protein